MNPIRWLKQRFSTPIHLRDIEPARAPIKGFNFLGFHYQPSGMRVSDATLSRRDKKIARLYEQGASKRRFGRYLVWWIGWAGITCAGSAWGIGGTPIVESTPIAAYTATETDIAGDPYTLLYADCQLSTGLYNVVTNASTPGAFVIKGMQKTFLSPTPAEYINCKISDRWRGVINAGPDYTGDCTEHYAKTESIGPTEIGTGDYLCAYTIGVDNWYVWRGKWTGSTFEDRIGYTGDLPVNGTCGTSNGQTLATEPTTNLCDTGTAGTVSATDTGWSWSCTGENGGTTDDTCSANKGYTITATASPVEGGSVSCDDDTVSHGGSTNCSATANTGYVFDRFTNCNDQLVNRAAANTCTVSNVTANTTVTASFSAIIDGACGTSSGQTLTSAPATNLCETGTAGTVSATDTGWSWSCIGENGGTTDDTCSANIKSYTITATASPIEGGSVSCNDDTVNHGGSTFCRATVNTGYVFDRFTNCIDEAQSRLGANVCTVSNVTANTTVTASFSAITDGACGTSNGQTLATEPTTNLCDTGTAGTVSATDTGWSWSCTGENGGTTDDSCSANKGYTITATASPVEGGSVRCDDDTVNHGGSTNCSATANPGYVFDRFSNCIDGALLRKTGNTCTVSNVTADTTVTATFSAITDGACGTSNGQTLATEPTTNLCSTGTAGAVSATDTGWSWSCTGENGGTTDDSCSANIKSYTITATASPVEGGSVSCDDDTVNHGGSTNCSATANTGYVFDRFTNCNDQLEGRAAANTCTVSNVTANTTVTASFSANPQVDGTCGSDNGQQLTSPPTNLCASGSPSALEGSGPWSWSCAGENDGALANCSATLDSGGATGVTAQPADGGGLLVQWTAQPGATGYRVLRDGLLLTTTDLAANLNSYLDSSAVAGVKYNYQVVAILPAGNLDLGTAAAAIPLAMETQPVPTLSEWALILLSSLLGLMMLGATRRTQR
jgi:hypothetical protein